MVEMETMESDTLKAVAKNRITDAVEEYIDYIFDEIENDKNNFSISNVSTNSLKWLKRIQLISFPVSPHLVRSDLFPCIYDYKNRRRIIILNYML